MAYADRRIEPIARALAEHIHMTTLRHNLREINQEDQLAQWLAMYPVRVTDDERALACVALEALDGIR